MARAHRIRLILLAAAFVAATMVMHPVPVLAQTTKPDEQKTAAQVEGKGKPEEKKTEEKGKLEQQKTNQQRSVPQTGSILLGIGVGALLVVGGLLARGRIGVGPTSSEEGGFVDVVRRVVLRPAGFFSNLPRGGNLLNPLLFALICIEISAVLAWLLVLVGVQNNPGFNPNPQNLGVPSVYGSASPVVSVILAPIGGTIGIILAALIQQLLVRLIVGARNSGYGATLKVASYTQVTSLVNWIPVIGPLLALYGIYLSIVGIREVHQTTTGRAALVVLIPFVVALLVAILVVGAALFALTQR